MGECCCLCRFERKRECWCWKRVWDFLPWWSSQGQRRQCQQEWQSPKRESTIYCTAWWHTSIDPSEWQHLESLSLVGWYSSSAPETFLGHHRWEWESHLKNLKKKEEEEKEKGNAFWAYSHSSCAVTPMFSFHFASQMHQHFLHHI